MGMNTDQIDARANALMRELFGLALELRNFEALAHRMATSLSEYESRNSDLYGLDAACEMLDEVALSLSRIKEPTLEEVNAEREQAALDFAAECKRDDLLVGVL
jgi:hypothetical protein